MRIQKFLYHVAQMLCAHFGSMNVEAKRKLHAFFKRLHKPFPGSPSPEVLWPTYKPYCWKIARFQCETTRSTYANLKHERDSKELMNNNSATFIWHFILTFYSVFQARRKTTTPLDLLGGATEATPLPLVPEHPKSQRPHAAAAQPPTDTVPAVSTQRPPTASQSSATSKLMPPPPPPPKPKHIR